MLVRAERHLLFIRGSNEHAEGVPVVGQFQDVIVMAIGRGELGVVELVGLSHHGHRDSAAI